MVKASKWVPWYRRKDYKGNLSEEEKRHLDGFRLQDKHPAAAYEDLPSEVQSYIVELELKVYDSLQDAEAGRAFVGTGVAAFIVFAAYHNLIWADPVVGYAIGAAVFGFSWLWYWRQWKRNAEALWIKGEAKGVPFSRTQEMLQFHWEIEEIERHRMREKPAQGLGETLPSDD